VLVVGNICLNSSGSGVKGDGIHCIVDDDETQSLERITVANNIIRDCNGIGIDISSNEELIFIEGCMIQGNQVFNAGSTGYKLSRNKRSTFMSNILDGAGGVGLSLGLGCDQCVINGNSLSNMDGIGISVFQNDNLTLTNNVVANAGVTGTAAHSITFNTVDGYIVTGNTITDADGFSLAWLRVDGDINPSYRIFHDNHATGAGQTTGSPGIQGTLGGTVLGYNDSSVYESSNLSEA